MGPRFTHQWFIFPKKLVGQLFFSEKRANRGEGSEGGLWKGHNFSGFFSSDPFPKFNTVFDQIDDKFMNQALFAILAVFAQDAKTGFSFFSWVRSNSSSLPTPSGRTCVLLYAANVLLPRLFREVFSFSKRKKSSVIFALYFFKRFWWPYPIPQ